MWSSKHFYVCLRRRLPTLSRAVSSYSLRDIFKRDATLTTGTVETMGWVKSLRVHKEVVFIHITDGSYHRPLQIVATPDILPSGVSFGCALSAHGEVRPSNAREELELLASRINLVGTCDAKEFPLKARKQHSQEYTRKYLHLRPRTSTFGALLRVRHAASAAMHDYFNGLGYLHVHTPILTSNDCEGAGEVFRVQPASNSDDTTKEKSNASQEDVGTKNTISRKNFFGVPTFLTVSGQLQLEALAGAFSKVYTFGPTFRAENSRSRHHLSEFYMIEAELAFVESVSQIAEVIEHMLKYTSQVVMKNCEEDVHHITKHLARDTNATMDNIHKILEKPFENLSYQEAIDILERSDKKFIFPVKWGIDLQKEHERHLVDHVGGVPVFITDFPSNIKPFYMKQNDDHRTVAALDLLAAGVGEIAGGSLREHRLPVLEQALHELNMTDSYDWYLDLRRYGSVPHGGFGLGLERYLQNFLGIDNIHDTIPFPRYLNSCHM